MTVTHSKALTTRRKRQSTRKRLAREAKKADRLQKQDESRPHGHRRKSTRLTRFTSDRLAIARSPKEGRLRRETWVSLCSFTGRGGCRMAATAGRDACFRPGDGHRPHPIPEADGEEECVRSLLQRRHGASCEDRRHHDAAEGARAAVERYQSARLRRHEPEADRPVRVDARDEPRSLVSRSGPLPRERLPAARRRGDGGALPEGENPVVRAAFAAARPRESHHVEARSRADRRGRPDRARARRWRR